MANGMGERQDRLAKLKKFAEPYPSSAHRTYLIKEVLDKFESLKEEEFFLAGRIMSKREHGKLTFCDLLDESGKIQLVFQQDEVGQDKYKILGDIDMADILEIAGKTFVTKKGQKSILVKEFRLLAKALEPLPEKWHGISDEEIKFRKRYLDILLNSELGDLFRKKAIFWQSMRTFLVEKGFLEVETPVLETTPGGADAQPFVTHHNALDIDLYLRISMGELWQKRLMVANFGKTFEIGRQFRNEGIDAEHLQDYSQMEFYMGYANYEDTMKIVEEMYKFVIEKTFGTLKFKIKNFDVDFGKKWDKIDYQETLKKELKIDILTATDADLINKCKELKLEVIKKAGRGRLIDTLWKKVRKTIAGPVFLINHPVEVSPLAKRKKDNPALVERYQVIIAGSEVGNGYSELNDPLDQAERFKEQAKMREAGDSEAQMHDQDFVEALEHGMPPTSGFGVSERLFAFLANRPIRECVLFPLLKPKK
jgi:lysyl-tRNA synthetase class 2